MMSSVIRTGGQGSGPDPSTVTRSTYEQSGPQEWSQNVGSGQPVVLVAEDEEPIAAALMLIIEDAGYVPLVAAHGKAALDMIRQRHPALIITDLMMPYLDGAELISAVRADFAHDNHVPPPIVLMTAAGVRRAQEAGADAVLRKPFNIEDVEALLSRFLGTEQRQTDSGELLP